MHIYIYIHTHTHTLFKILFPYRSLQTIQKSSMCYTVGPSCVSVFSLLVMSDSLCPIGLQPARLLCPWNISDRNTGVGCHFLLQGIFANQGSNSCLFHLLLFIGGFFTTVPPGKSRSLLVIYFIYSSFKVPRTQWKVQNNGSSLR